jgi:hypothetical protein
MLHPKTMLFGIARGASNIDFYYNTSAIHLEKAEGF